MSRLKEQYYALTEIIKLRWILLFLFALSISCFLSSCATMGRGTSIKLPADPIVKPVEVHDGCVCGKDLDNVIDNWENLGEAYDVCKELSK